MRTQLPVMIAAIPVSGGDGEDGTMVLPGVSVVFQRNLVTLIRGLLVQGRSSLPTDSPLLDARTRETVQMLLREFPRLKDFEQLGVLGQLYAENGFRPLKPVPVPGAAEMREWPAELARRFYEGCFVLADGEALVVQNGFVQGPLDRPAACRLARRLSAASPTNDAQGHILDPETHQPTPAFVLAPDLNPLQPVGGL